MSSDEFPSDTKQRADTILKDCGGYSIGSYSYSVGVEVIRKHVAEYIQRRDGVFSDYENVILFSGASEAIRAVLNVLNYPKNGKPSGILIPVPQYPLYSSTLQEYGMYEIKYFLDEENGWGINIMEIKSLLDEARKCCHPRAIVIINPGNPTGSVFSENTMKEIIKFAYDEKLFIMADEVYQDSTYFEDSKFLSFKKVISEMNHPYNKIELVSFMSASKGYMGECGLRGGYCEIVNVLPTVMEVLVKSISAKLCPSVMGQAAIDCVVNAPQPGEPSFDVFNKEKNEVLFSLKQNAEYLFNELNKFNIICTKVLGAIYAFPRLILPQKFIEKAQAKGMSPDYYYALQLLETTGVCVMPGCIFGQKPNTYHFRISLASPINKLKKIVNSILEFQEKLLDEHN
ncbi:alanine aminotransferase 2-like isoform X2 [Centruroides vittatus]